MHVNTVYLQQQYRPIHIFTDSLALYTADSYPRQFKSLLGYLIIKSTRTTHKRPKVFTLAPQKLTDMLCCCVFIATSCPLFTKQSQTSVSAANSKLIRNKQLQGGLPKGCSFLINVPYPAKPIQRGGS